MQTEPQNTGNKYKSLSFKKYLLDTLPSLKFSKECSHRLSDSVLQTKNRSEDNDVIKYLLTRHAAMQEGRSEVSKRLFPN